MLLRAGNVPLVVYNLLGQKVRILVNRKQDVGGYSVQFNNFSAGFPLLLLLFLFYIRELGLSNKGLLIKTKAQSTKNKVPSTTDYQLQI